MNHPLGPLPNFFVVGTAKSGTTSLAEFLARHPEVCFCEAHEPNFFAFDHYYQRGLDAYRSRYRHFSGEKAVGEKSWRYSCAGTYPKALDRMVEAIPRFKVLYVTRDPVPRALSMWRELRDAGQDIIAADPNEALTSEGLVVDSSRYDAQIRRFEDAVGPDNVKVMLFEDYAQDSESFLRAVCAFLDIAEVPLQESIHANPSVGQSTDTALLSSVRRAGLDAPLRRLLPEGVRRIARRTLKRPVGDVTITEDTRRRFLDLVGEDCARLLDRVDRDRSVWTLT